MKIDIKFDKGNSKKYRAKAICNSIIYANKIKTYLWDIYYLIS